MIIFLVIWNIIISFIAVTALLGSYMNTQEIDAIKSWYPFCEIMKLHIPDKDDFELEDEDVHIETDRE